MTPWLLEHWPKATPFLAVYTTLFLGIFVLPRDQLIFWIWLQTPIYWLHQFEEHVYPGGLVEFVNVRALGSPEADWPLTPARSFWAAVPLPFVAFPASGLLAWAFGPEYGIWTAYYAVLLAAAHVLASVAFWTISPGLISALLVNMPLGAVSIWTFHMAAPMAPHLHIIGLEVAIICHGAQLIWVLKFLRAEVENGKQGNRRRRSSRPRVVMAEE